MHVHAPHAHAPHKHDAPAGSHADAPVDAPVPRRGLLARLLEPEMLVGLSAILLSVCGLGVAVYEADLERHFHYAQVWPHLEVGSRGPSGGNGGGVVMRNSGIGPAIVRTVEITVDGKPQRQWSDVMRALLRTDRGLALTYSNARTNVLRPGQIVEMLVLPADTALTRAYFTERRRIGVTVCYASVFEQHWTLELANLEDADPVIRETRGCDERGPGAGTNF